MIFRQQDKYVNYFYRYAENIKTGYLENYLMALDVDTVELRKKVKARIRRLNQCLKAIDAAEAGGDEKKTFEEWKAINSDKIEELADYFIIHDTGDYFVHDKYLEAYEKIELLCKLAFDGE